MLSAHGIRISLGDSDCGIKSETAPTPPGQVGLEELGRVDVVFGLVLSLFMVKGVQYTVA